MDYYKTLKISENATDKEINEAYNILSATYDPAFNTSPIAHKKYREIQLAYKMLQNKKLLHLEEDKDEFFEDNYDLFDYEKYFNANKEHVYISKEKRDINEYKDVSVNKDVILDDYKYKKEIEVDYLAYVLNSKIEISVYENEACPNATEKVCNQCNGIGKVLYQKEVALCPKCQGNGNVKECQCHNHAHLKKERLMTIDFSQIDPNKPLILLDTYITFQFLNKEKIKETKDEIQVVYDLSKEEILKGVSKKYLTDVGSIEIVTSNFENDYICAYKNKQIIIHFNLIPFDGDNLVKTILLDKKDFNKNVYLNLNDLTYSLEPSKQFIYKLHLKNLEGQVVIEGQGEKGYLEGKDGDLILNYYVCTGYNTVDNTKPIKIVETSFLYNLFGGKGNIGFKGKNYLVEKENEVLILTGRKSQKDYLKNYLWLKIFIYLLWLFIPLILFVSPLSKDLFIALCVVSISYSLLANILLRIKI